MVVAAAVAAFLLGPFITRTWQNHDRELDIKGSIVRQMSDASGALIVAVLEEEFHPGAENPRFVNDFRAWDVERQNIALQLQTYFNSELEQQWLRYARVLLDYYNLEGIDRPGKRREQIHTIESYIGGGVRYPRLYTRPGTARRAADRLYQATWRRLEDDLIRARSVLAQRVLDANSRF